MTDAQGRRLWDRAAALEAGAQVVEIGSYQGRSTIVLASAAPDGVAVIAIDPHAGNDRGPQQFNGPAEFGQSDHERFSANLAAAGVAARVRHVRLPSHEAHDSVEGAIQLLYIDGAHRLSPALRDIRTWPRRVPTGGALLIHDSFSSIGVTLSLMATMFFGSRFRYAGRTGSLSEYRRVDLSPAERMANAARQIAELPWFVRNVIVKALIVAKLGRITPLLAHKTETWPY